MSKRANFPLGRHMVAGAMVAVYGLLSACAPGEPIADDKLAELDRFGPPHEVQFTTHDYLVPINQAKSEFTDRTLRDVYGFLVGAGARPGDTVILAARETNLDQRASLVTFIRRLGLQPDLRTIKAPSGGVADGYETVILIRYDRYIALQPECGIWENDPRRNFYNVAPPNFGCSTTAALDQQIAYPASLISGTPLGMSGGASVSQQGGSTTTGGAAAAVAGGISSLGSSAAAAP